MIAAEVTGCEGNMLFLARTNIETPHHPYLPNKHKGLFAYE